MKTKRLYVYIIFTLFLLSCSQKQKQYVPLIGLVQDSTSSSSSGSNTVTSSVGDVTVVAGGTKSDIAQTPETTTTISTPVVSITGSVGTISSSNSEPVTSTETTNSTSATTPDSSSSSPEPTASTTENSSTNTSSSSSSSTDTSLSSSNSSSSTTTVTENTATDISSTTNTNSNTSSTSSSTSNSLATIQPSVTVTMGSSSNTIVTLAGSILDSKENTIGQATVILTGINTNGQTLSIYSGTSTVEGAISGEFTIPSGVSNLSLVLSISGNASQSVKIPVSVTTECKEDNNKGHGNDADGVDEDNTGNSTGVNSNAMENRKSNDKKKDTCVAGTKYISRIGNITLPIQASQLAFLQENSNLMAYLNGTDGNHTFAVILIILFVGLGLFLRRKFLAV